VLPWPFIVWTWWPIQTIYALHILAFVLLAAGMSWRPVRYRLVPRSIKHARAHRRALEQFLAQDLHTTDGRTGVLIFVSVAERYAEIIADAGIHARVPERDWQAIVDRLVALIGDGRPGDGFVEAVTAVGSRLAEHFPPGTIDPNQLPNHLIVLGEP
jgi:putative membrane protein